MKNIYRIVVLTLVLFGFQAAKASHVMGSEMHYRSLGNDRYEITVKIYRDCNGIQVSQSNIIARCSSTTITLSSQTKLSVRDVTGIGQGCQDSSRCHGGTYPYGIEEHIWVTTLDLSSYSCCEWTLSWEQCCRNGNITTGQSGENYYVTAQLNKCTGANSSPLFTSTPVIFLLAGESVIINMGIYDSLDGYDSVAFELVNAMTGINSSVTYAGTFSPLRPLTFLGYPNINAAYPGGFRLSPITGDLLFTPTVANQIAVLAIGVREYKRIAGIMTLIGITRRDIQVIVLPNSQNFKSPYIANYSNPIIFTCPGDTVNFEVITADSNTSDTTRIFWNSGIPGASFTENNGQQQHATGNFKWVPGTADIREAPYSVTFIVEDNSCPLSRKIARSYQILVRDSFESVFANAGPDISDQNNDTSYSLNATIANSGYLVPKWKTSGDGYFSNIYGNSTTYFQGPKDKLSCSYELYFGIFDIASCDQQLGKYVDTLLVNKGVIAPYAGLDVEFYMGDSLTLVSDWADTLGQSAYWRSTGDGTFSDTLAKTTSYSPGPFDLQSCEWNIVLNTFGTGCELFSDTLNAKRKMGTIAAGGDQFVLHGDTVFLSGTGDTSFNQLVGWKSLGDGVFGDTLNPSTWYLPGAGDLQNCSASLVLQEFPLSNCYASIDTLTYYKVQPIWEAGSNLQLFFGDSAQLSALPSASSNYQFGYWTTAGDGQFIDSNAAQTQYIPGTSDWANCGTTLYWNEIDQNCGGRTDSLKILRVTTTVSAGGDQSLYYHPSLSYTLQGSSDTANGQLAYWSTSGDGSFNDSFDLNAIYTPGTGDLQNCEATLTLIAYPSGSCTVFDEMLIHIQDSAVKILGAAVDSMAFDTVYVSLYSVANRANLSWTTNGSGSFISANSTVVAYVLSPADKTMSNLELTVQNDAPCLTSMDTLRVNPTLRLPNGLEERANNYSLYPNPSDGKLHLRTEGADQIQNLSIYDIHGKEMMLTPHFEELTYTWDVSGLSKGMYVLAVTDEQGAKQALRFIVR
ncbi:MAG: T9SS type A sorting domain-containing protein [Bacteroidia bacterium]